MRSRPSASATSTCRSRLVASGKRSARRAAREETTMYPAPFEYHAPSTIAEALALLSQHGGDAKVIAGSQSLVPLMKFRLATPAHVVDLRKVPGITGIREEGGALVIGALTNHRTIERSEDLRKKLPILPEAASAIGDPQVRNHGTIGRSQSRGADRDPRRQPRLARVQGASCLRHRGARAAEGGGAGGGALVIPHPDGVRTTSTRSGTVPEHGQRVLPSISARGETPSRTTMVFVVVAKPGALIVTL